MIQDPIPVPPCLRLGIPAQRTAQQPDGPCKQKHNNLLRCIDNVIIEGYDKTKKGVMIMATTNINVRVDSELKQNAENLFNDLGLNMSVAITMFLKSAVSHDGIPFELKRQTPNADTIAALAEYEEMKRNKAAYKSYSSFDDMFDEITADA